MLLSSEMAQQIDENCDEIQDELAKNSRRAYSIAELESFRFLNLEDQPRRWREVYRSLESDAAKEYDGLRAPNLQNKKETKTTKKKKTSKIIDAPYIELEDGVQMEDKEIKVDALQRNGEFEAQDVDRRTNEGRRDCGSGKGLSYSRNEMEALRFVNVDEQGRRWKEVYDKFSSDVVEEFDGLRVDCHQKKKKQLQPRDAGWQKSAGKKMDPSKRSGNVLAVKSTNSPEVQNDCGDTLDRNGNGTDIEEPLDEYDVVNDEDESNSDECDSIQRPAFFVEGEPDFESGPPLDGLEYLRRVRWESAQIPKVKVVKLDSSKLTSEQTAYMPSIPEIPKCPQNLLPSKDWENVFLAEFSELRQEITVLQSSCKESSLNNVGKAPSKQSDCIQQLKKNPPTLEAILGMDAVCRAATLRKSISSFEAASSLSRDDCLWLFALCAAVDTPLHADTCASLRCLLRKCSGLLAIKSEPDAEVALLSILTAIAGKYFRQLDNL